MRTRASFALMLLAFAQLIVLLGAFLLLAARLRDVEKDVIRVSQEEQLFLAELGDTERDLYRTSILLRDDIILEGPEQARANQELISLLRELSERPFRGPAWLTPSMQDQVREVDSVRREYLILAQTVIAWQEKDRKRLGASYLKQQLAPMRERFSVAAKQSISLVQSLGESRSQAMAASVGEIESIVVRILLGAGVLGLALAGAAIWGFRNYERERDKHIDQLKVAENSMRSLSQRLVDSQEEERKKLSRELHDEVGQILTALRVQLGQVDTQGDASRTHLDQASELAERSLRTVREMARGIRPAMLDDLGLGPALKWLGRDFSKNTALEVEVELEGELLALNDQLRTCIYRVVQEALTNCVKHSGVSSARVLIHESPNELVLTIQDTGVGIAPGKSGGIGILGMSERVEELNGEFSVVSSPAAGTLIRAIFPKSTIE